MEKHRKGTHSTKMGSDKSAKCLKIHLPKLSAQAQKDWDFEGFTGPP
jgi:hypothetical protein